MHYVITSGVYADGSFGIQAKRNGDVMRHTVVVDPRDTLDRSKPCAHRTERSAKECPNRPSTDSLGRMRQETE